MQITVLNSKGEKVEGTCTHGTPEKCYRIKHMDKNKSCINDNSGKKCKYWEDFQDYYESGSAAKE